VTLLKTIKNYDAFYTIIIFEYNNYSFERVFLDSRGSSSKSMVRAKSNYKLWTEHVGFRINAHK